MAGEASETDGNSIVVLEQAEEGELSTNGHDCDFDWLGTDYLDIEDEQEEKRLRNRVSLLRSQLCSRETAAGAARALCRRARTALGVFSLDGVREEAATSAPVVLQERAESHSLRRRGVISAEIDRWSASSQSATKAADAAVCRAEVLLSNTRRRRLCLQRESRSVQSALKAVESFVLSALELCRLDGAGGGGDGGGGKGGSDNEDNENQRGQQKTRWPGKNTDTNANADAFVVPPRPALSPGCGVAEVETARTDLLRVTKNAESPALVAVLDAVEQGSTFLRKRDARGENLQRVLSLRSMLGLIFAEASVRSRELSGLVEREKALGAEEEERERAEIDAALRDAALFALLGNDTSTADGPISFPLCLVKGQGSESVRHIIRTLDAALDGVRGGNGDEGGGGDDGSGDIEDDKSTKQSSSLGSRRLELFSSAKALRLRCEEALAVETRREMREGISLAGTEIAKDFLSEASAARRDIERALRDGNAEVNAAVATAVAAASAGHDGILPLSLTLQSVVSFQKSDMGGGGGLRKREREGKRNVQYRKQWHKNVQLTEILFACAVARLLSALPGNRCRVRCYSCCCCPDKHGFCGRKSRRSRRDPRQGGRGRRRRVDSIRAAKRVSSRDQRAPLLSLLSPFRLPREETALIAPVCVLDSSTIVHRRSRLYTIVPRRGEPPPLLVAWGLQRREPRDRVRGDGGGDASSDPAWGGRAEAATSTASR